MPAEADQRRAADGCETADDAGQSQPRRSDPSSGRTAGSDQTCDQFVERRDGDTHQHGLVIDVPQDIVVLEHGHLRRRLRHLPSRGGVRDAQPTVRLVTVGGEVAERAGEDHPSGGEERHLVAPRRQVVHAVTGEHHGRSLRRQAPQHTMHVTRADRVKSVGRLVEHQQPGPGKSAVASQRVADPVAAITAQPGQRRRSRVS